MDNLARIQVGLSNVLLELVDRLSRFSEDLNSPEVIRLRSEIRALREIMDNLASVASLRSENSDSDGSI